MEEDTYTTRVRFAPHAGKGVLGELDPANVLTARDDGIQLAVVENGTKSGKPVVLIRMNLDYGKIVLARVTAQLFCSVAKLIEARYPELKSSLLTPVEEEE